MPLDPEALLKSVFGYSTFRPLQREVIEAVLNKQDTLVIMPTGAGKSLCYQIPALLFSGLTVVVSPLISLMKDQVEQLRQVGVPALFLNSSLSPDEYDRNVREVLGSKVKLLYVAPETLLMARTFAILSSVQLDCLTIDEAHCISEWGHDFRPEYRQLVEVRKRFPQAVCLALTATATPRVRQDIRSSLNFADANEFIASFDRPNLLIEVQPKVNPLPQTFKFLERFKDQSGIIYCFTRKQVEILAQALIEEGYSALPYHAGMEDEERKANQEKFTHDDVQIIVATIAFGMGINKPNVRFVLHYDLPKSIESYYHEIGRAGRDGLPSVCQLLYTSSDAIKLRYFIDQKEGSERQVAMSHLQAMTRYAESDDCRRELLLEYFGEKYSKDNCGNCDNCLVGAQAEVDVTIPAQKFLSCVKRTGERFGAGHVSDVLLGSRNEKVMLHHHDLLSTYGIGKELSRQQWMKLAHQLVRKGLLEEVGDYHVLRLTPAAYTALKNKDPVMGVIHEKERPLKVKTSGEVEYDAGLFGLLRKVRKELADAEKVPPYAVFSDRTLVEMAAYYPLSEAALKKINGVGTVKAARYGKTFLELIRGYCQEHHLAEKVKPTERAARGSLSGYRTAEVAAAYNAGASIQALMKRYAVKASTIVEHLSQFSLQGGQLRLGNDLLELSALRPELQQAALMAFSELGTDHLKPVFDRLSGAVSYDELKIMRVIFFSSQKKFDDHV
jgi:ATP-dependent DNA helicase RecQ